jgi:hypothetical protein
MTVALMGPKFSGVDAHLAPFEKLVDPLPLFAAPKKTVAAKVATAVKKVVPTKKA